MDVTYSEWVHIRRSAKSICEAVHEGMTFMPDTELDKQIENRLTDQLDRHLDKMCGFISDAGISKLVDQESIIERWEMRKNCDDGEFGRGKVGVRNKFSMLQLLITIVEEIYRRELSAVEKVEHALTVLDRKLIMSDDLKRSWTEAYSYEPNVEKLGALHLLECGIWAYKVTGNRSETDLILDQGVNYDQVRVPLVLTEWKKADDETEANIKIQDAINQCEDYGSGIARPLKVNCYRFVIVVSPGRKLQVEDERVKGRNNYFIRSIGIRRPDSSEEARKSRNRSGI